MTYRDNINPDNTMMFSSWLSGRIDTVKLIDFGAFYVSQFIYAAAAGVGCGRQQNEIAMRNWTCEILHIDLRTCVLRTIYLYIYLMTWCAFDCQVVSGTYGGENGRVKA